MSGYRDDRNGRGVDPMGLAVVSPTVAFGTVMLLDRALSARSWSVPMMAMLDEPGHLLTAALVLGALPFGTLSGRWAWALAGSVALDIDHVPMYTFAPEFIASGRPPTHSLMTALALLLMAGLLPRLRSPLAGLSLGVCLHLLRDLATGPGVPLLWPLSATSVRAPYETYVGILGAVTLIATWRIARHRRTLHSGSEAVVPERGGD